MSIESLLAEVKQRKLFVSNLYEGADRQWRCFLRAKRNDLNYINRGQGVSMEGALSSALADAAAAEATTIEDLLGD